MDYVRRKTYYCGDKYIECEMYLISSSAYLHRNPRNRTGQQTSEKQRNSNQRNSLKKLRRLIISNFATGVDWYLGITYNDHFLPVDDKAAVADARGWKKRLQDMCKRQGIECRIIIITERGKEKGRIHHHAFVNGNVPLDLIQKAWCKKLINEPGYPKESMGHIQPDKVPTDISGLGCLSSYTLKCPIGKHQWIATRNLIQPEIEINDDVVSRNRFVKLGYGGFELNEMYLLLCEMYPSYIPVKYDGFTIEALNHSPYMTASLVIKETDDNTFKTMGKLCNRYDYSPNHIIKNPVTSCIARNAVDRWILLNTDKIPNLQMILNQDWRTFMSTHIYPLMKTGMTVFQAERELDKQVASMNAFSKVLLSYIGQNMKL